jgi:hypothetical protein
MTILLEPYQLFMIAATSLAAFFGLGKLLARQVLDNIDTKLSSFKDIKAELKDLSIIANNTERDLLRIKGDIAQQYVRRDDFVRLESTISAKLDSLAEKIDHLRERGNP